MCCRARHHRVTRDTNFPRLCRWSPLGTPTSGILFTLYAPTCGMHICATHKRHVPKKEAKNARLVHWEASFHIYTRCLIGRPAPKGEKGNEDKSRLVCVVASLFSYSRRNEKRTVREPRVTRRKVLRHPSSLSIPFFPACPCKGTW